MAGRILIAISVLLLIFNVYNELMKMASAVETLLPRAYFLIAVVYSSF